VVSASYNPDVNGIGLKLYNDETEKMEIWVDSSFKAYFLTKMKPSLTWKSIIKKELVTKYDALRDKNIKVWKVTVNNPRAVKNSHDINDARENHIKFFQCYIYDNDIKMGMPYKRKNGILEFQIDQDAQDRIQQILSCEDFEGLSQEDREIFEKWASLLEYPAPDFKRASLDIEVMNKDEKKIPNPENSILPVLAACISTNRGERIAYILIQEGKRIEKIPDNVDKVMFFTEEAKMLLAIFEKINEYPFIITFNGDDFDLRYLYHRALRFGLPELKIPIIVRERICMLKNAVHIDLYKFFFIKAMRIYAFKAKYKDVKLDTVAKALIGKGKITGEEKWVGKMSYHDLIKYCMNDANITLELTTYNNNLVMNLILMLERISRLPIENVSRKSVSNWIKSFMLYEHRQRNILIPTPEEIKAVKGQTISEAVIKGKKYKGAIVFDPISGTHFSVLVLDFASLYPSIFKVYNLGYSTINCPHPECKSNTVGELSHWICKKNRALESLLIGSLRDLRVFWYKKKAKDKSLNEKLKTWYSVAEQSIKVIMNASYGVFGAESFIFYCPPVAEETTAIARYIISKTAEHAQEIGIEVLYGDTDSIFIKKPSEEKLKELIEWTQEKYGIEFEVDKEYRYVCLSGRKKNYLGVTIKGDVDVKGLTGKKKHTPKIIKDVFNETKEVLKEVETLEQIEVSKGKIIALLRTIYSTFKHREWKNMEDLSFNVTVTRELDEYKKTTPQHVKAARMLKAQGYDVEAGMNISFVKTNKKLTGGVTVKPVELAKRTEVDVSKYVEFLKSTFEQILEPLNISFEEDILGVTRLVKWMKKA